MTKTTSAPTGEPNGEPIRGGCHCGAIRYTLRAEPNFAFTCHCDNCRKLHGGARLAGASASLEALEISGSPTAYRYRGGKDEITAHFCPHCGASVYAVPAAYDDVAVLRIGTLDDETRIPRVKAIFADQACRWENLG